MLLIALAVVWIGVAVGSPLTGRTTFLPTTILSTFAPWHAAAPNDEAVNHYCEADNVDGVQPGRALATRDLRAGGLAQLDPYQVGGTPTVLSQDTGLFDPVTLVPFTTLPLRVAPAYLKVLELLAALIGMVLFVRRLGMSTAAGVVGGTVFGVSGFMVTWTNWPQTSVACWIPMLFWAVERLAQRRDLSSALLVSLPLASMILGGFPAVTGWTVYAAAAYLGMRLLAQQRRGRALVGGSLLAGLGAALALGLSAFMLLPFFRTYSEQSLTYRVGAGANLESPNTLVTALFPGALGGCGLGPHAAPWLLTGNSSVPVESDMFVGTAALVLVLVALTGRLRPGVPRGPRVFMALLTVFLLNQIYEHDWLQHAVAQLPVFDTSRPGRLRALVGLSTAVLAAMGVDRVLARAWRPHWWRRWQTVPVALVWAAAAGLAAYAAVHTHHLDVAAARTDGAPAATLALTHGIETALAVAAAAALVVAVAASVRRAARPAVLVLAIIVAVQGAAFARGFWPRDPNRSYYPSTPTTRLLTARLGDYRVTGDAGALRSGTGTYYQLAQATGHAFTTPEWSDLLAAVTPSAALTPTFSQLRLDDRSVDSPVLDAMSVRYVVRADDDAVLGADVPPPRADGTVDLRATAPVTAPLGPASLRGVVITLAAPLSVARAPYAALRVDLLDASGTVVGSGTRRIYTDAPAGQVFPVAVTDSAPGQPVTARVGLVGDPNQTSLTAADGHPALGLVTATDDGLSIVLSDGAVVYERASALPPVRWASTRRSVPPGQQVAALEAAPPGQVVLDPPAPGSGSGQPATVAVREKQTRTVRADVTAAGAGYLVVSTANRPGWSATVDGQPTPVLDADHGLQAVAVPAGSHQVQLHYAAPGVRTGIAVTLATLVLTALLWAVVAVRFRRISRRDRQPAVAGARRRRRELRRRPRRPRGGEDRAAAR